MPCEGAGASWVKCPQKTQPSSAPCLCLSFLMGTRQGSDPTGKAGWRSPPPAVRGQEPDAVLMTSIRPPLGSSHLPGQEFSPEPQFAAPHSTHQWGHPPQSGGSPSTPIPDTLLSPHPVPSLSSSHPRAQHPWAPSSRGDDRWPRSHHRPQQVWGRGSWGAVTARPGGVWAVQAAPMG